MFVCQYDNAAGGRNACSCRIVAGQSARTGADTAEQLRRDQGFAACRVQGTEPHMKQMDKDRQEGGRAVSVGWRRPRRNCPPGPHPAAEGAALPQGHRPSAGVITLWRCADSRRCFNLAWGQARPGGGQPLARPVVTRCSHGNRCCNPSCRLFAPACRARDQVVGAERTTWPRRRRAISPRIAPSANPAQTLKSNPRCVDSTIAALSEPHAMTIARASLTAGYITTPLT